ncbi:protein of unknown function [Tepidibacter aestuarii]|nr:protein of unknown function [Tepidibacter aestuarii]
MKLAILIKKSIIRVSTFIISNRPRIENKKSPVKKVPSIIEMNLFFVIIMCLHL